MCEDRSSPLKRGMRLNRIHHARMRSRMARRMRPAPPVRNNVPSTQLVAEPIRASLVPVSTGAVAPATSASFQHMQRLNVSNKHSDGPWQKLQPRYQIRRESLIEIAMRTVMLMKQNQQLQQKLAALQAETKMFMQTVMNNPETKASAENTDTPKEDSPECEIKVERNEESHVIKTEKE
ncbi:clock interacting protein circadian [Arctopsyche grandis]|uniref:clock interacting protein circadian n=1 Tax=Arctopsyche grandis TaxID=121162 RepID=UPI00406D8BA1